MAKRFTFNGKFDVSKLNIAGATIQEFEDGVIVELPQEVEGLEYDAITDKINKATIKEERANAGDVARLVKYAKTQGWI